MMISEKRAARKAQQDKLSRFIIGSETTLHLAEMSRIPGKLFSDKVTVFTKEEEKLNRAGALHYIKKDGVSQGFVWHANKDALLQALTYGLIPVESAGAKAISTLGQYRQKVLHRAYSRGIISNKNQQKLALLDMTQANLIALLPLEQLANTLNSAVDLSANELNSEKKRIKSKLKEARNLLKLQKREISTRLSSLYDYDKKAADKMTDHYKRQIGIIEGLMTATEHADLKKIKTMMKPTGADSIMTVSKTMCMATALKAQELNQNISYSRRQGSLLRGDFNCVLEDALKELRDHQADPHNPVLPEHQGCFASNGRVAIDFSHLANNKEVAAATLQSLLEIDGQGLLANTSEGILKKTRFTKWQTNAGAGFLFKRMAAGLINVVIGMLVGLIVDLPLGFTSGLLTAGKYKMPSLAAYLKIEVDMGAPENPKFNELYQKLSIKTFFAGSVIGQKVGQFLSMRFIDIYKGIRETITNLKVKGFDELIVDFRTGAWAGNYGKTNKQQDVLNHLSIQMTKAQDQYTKIIDSIKLKEAKILTPQAGKSPRVEYSSSQLGAVPYTLGSGEWEDIFNAAASGVIAVNDTFVHHVHAKHPFTGLIFSSSYLAGGMAVLAPGIMSFLPSSYVKLAHTLRFFLSNGSLTEDAISFGFSQAKLFSAAFEAGLHGGDSWFAKGVKEFEKNPASTMLLATLALGSGYVNELDIPVYTEIMQELQTVDWTSIEGKISLMAIDLLIPKDANPEQDFRASRNALLQELRLQLPRLNEDQIQGMVNQIVDNKNIQTNVLDQVHQFKNALTDLSRLDEEEEGQVNQEILRLGFISLLSTNHDSLADLDAKTKRDILLLARHLFEGITDKSSMLRGLQNILYPPTHLSIFATTFTIITNYIPLTLRCLLSPFSASRQPWRDLGDKLIKDVTRIGHGLSHLATMCTRTASRVLFRGPADIISNEVVARMEGVIRNDSHTVSAANYQVSSSYEAISEQIRQTVSEPIDLLRKKSSAPASAIVSKRMQKSAVHAFKHKRAESNEASVNSKEDRSESESGRICIPL